MLKLKLLHILLLSNQYATGHVYNKAIGKDNKQKTQLEQHLNKETSNNIKNYGNKHSLI